MTRLLEIEFDAGVWTDVFADVVAVSTRRGRNRELGAYETGTLTVELRNDARQYDPDHAAGAYFGKLRPNRRVRFRATYNAVTYPVFLGYIDRITQNYGGPNDATATFAVSDRTKILNRVELPGSVWRSEVAADNPTFWFRLDEPAGSSTIRDAIAGQTLTAFGTPGLGDTGLATRDPGSALTQTDAISGFAGSYSAYLPAGTTPITLEAIIATTATAEGTAFAVGDPGDGIRFRLGVDAGGYAFFEASKTVAGAIQGATASSSSPINDGSPHHVVGIYTAGAFFPDPNLAIYVDGVAGGAGDLAVLAAVAGGRQEFAVGNTVGVFAGTVGLVGTVDEVAVYNNVMLAAGRIAAHAAARAAPWNADLPGPRLARVLVMAGVDPADYNLDAGTTPLQSTDLAGSALAYAQKVEETDLGAFFVTRDGILRFVTRDALVTGYPTSSVTVVDHQGGGLPYRSSSSDVDEADIITRATVSREGSVAVTYSDADAVDEFGLIDDTHDGLLHDDDTYSLSYAQWLVNTHRTPGSRLGSVELELTKDPATMYPGILARELADRVTYKRQPQNVGATIDADMRVESIAHETGGHYWRTTLELSPFNLGKGGYPVFVWDVTRWDEHVWGI